MPYLTAEDNARLLAEHGFPTIFTEIVIGRHKRHGRNFSIYFERPKEIYRLLKEHPEDIPFPDTIIPLRESNWDFFICYVPPPESIYVAHSIEWPPSEYRVIARSLSEYLDYEIERLCDEGADVEDIRHCGTLLGHPDVERIMREYEEN